MSAADAERDEDGSAMEDAGAGASAGNSRPRPVVEKRKGRGGRDDGDEEARYAGKAGLFDTLEAEAGPGAQQSVEGWIIFVTGIHEEASESDVIDKFSEYGQVSNISVELDRRTGFTKGYALVEFKSRKEAEAALEGMDGQELMGKQVRADWAFVKTDKGKSSSGRGQRREK